MTPDKQTTDFGFADVPVTEKTARVGQLFSAVSPYYDRMNDVLSGGAHRLWKNTAALMLDVHPGMRVLDLACGSGDMSARLRPLVGDNGAVVSADININMLRAGRKRNSPLLIQCNAESLPFPSRSFDRVIIAFGLRNITDKQTTLREIHRVLKFGGKAAVLEFTPIAVFRRSHHCYLTKILPFIGKIAANDADSYRYLGESILRFPPPAMLTDMLSAAGLHEARCLKFAAGAVALHIGQKRD